MRTLNIGVDVGNYDTKTQSTTTPSGFASYSKLPLSVEEYLFYKDRYYIQTENRFSYISDKTANDNMFILSLFGIAKEIRASAEKMNRKRMQEAEQNPDRKEKVVGVQGEIDRIQNINIGIGLPLVNFGKTKAEYIDYYRRRFDEPVCFNFSGHEYKLHMDKIACYPQDFAAVLTYNPKNEDSVIKKKTFYAIDIGGWTVDIVTIANNEVVPDKCTSKPLGVLAMYESIINEVEVQTGMSIEMIDAETVLKEEESFLPEDVKNIITGKARLWFEKIRNELVQYGVLLNVRPIIFIGGGAQLLKPFIRECREFVKYEFISDPRANARAYATLLAAER